MKKIFTLFIIFSFFSCEQQKNELTVLDNSDSEEITFIIELNTKGNSKIRKFFHLEFFQMLHLIRIVIPSYHSIQFIKSMC